MTVSLQNFSRTGTIHPGIFHGGTLWSDSVSPRATNIASGGQFKTNQHRRKYSGEHQLTLTLTLPFAPTLVNTNAYICTNTS